MQMNDERKYFEHSVKRKTFWKKLIFKTKDQERDFMISFEGMPENFIGTHPSVQCVIDCTEHFYQKPSPLNPNSLYSSTMLHM